jgi:hypothetical protein
MLPTSRVECMGDLMSGSRAWPQLTVAFSVVYAASSYLVWEATIEILVLEVACRAIKMAKK